MKIQVITINLKQCWSHFQMYFEIFFFYKLFLSSLPLKYTFWKVLYWMPISA